MGPRPSFPSSHDSLTRHKETAQEENEYQGCNGRPVISAHLAAAS